MAKIIWVFPGVGKSAVSDGKNIIDADYNLFQWNNVSAKQLHGPAGSYSNNPEFPKNYIDFVNSSDADIVLINCNISLLENFKDVTLVYPDVSLKGEFLERYQKRGDNNSFLSFMADEFEGMIDIIDNSSFRKYKITEKNVFLKDILQRKDLKFMFMTKKEVVELLSKGVELQNSENYKKTGCNILESYQFDKMQDLNEIALQIFEGERSIDFDKLKADFANAESHIEMALEEIRKEQLTADRRAGLSHEELADKIMQGIVNGALGIRYAEISPYSHGYEVTFGGSGPVGSTRNFKNRWECYCDFFEIGDLIASKIEKGQQNNEVFGKKCKEFNIDEMLTAIENREQEKISTYILAKNTDFKRAKRGERGSIATVMDVHEGKGLDGIVQHHYHGDWSSYTPVLQNSLVEKLVYLNGFCLDCINKLDASSSEKVCVVEYLKKHGTDISTSEKLDEWIKNNPDKCGFEENREIPFHGLNPETYQLYQDKGFCDAEIYEMIEEWGIDGVEKGYAEYQVMNSDNTVDKAVVIEMIGDLARFDGDFEACRQAEKDGVKFINDMDGLEKGCYVDTPWNREHCQFMLKENPEYRITNWLDLQSDYGKKYVEHFGNPFNEKESGLHEKISDAKDRTTKSRKNSKQNIKNNSEIEK